MIECEKDSSRQRNYENLGVRTQGNGIKSDPTARIAIGNVLTREAIINCDFSEGVLEGVERAESYMEDAFILREMRKDYNLFNSQLGILGTEKEMFVKYIRKETTLGAIAEKKGIAYETVQQKLAKMKNQLRKQMIVFMEKRGGESLWKE